MLTQRGLSCFLVITFILKSKRSCFLEGFSSRVNFWFNDVSVPAINRNNLIISTHQLEVNIIYILLYKKFCAVYDIKCSSDEA